MTWTSDFIFKLIELVTNILMFLILLPVIMLIVFMSWCKYAFYTGKDMLKEGRAEREWASAAMGLIFGFILGCASIIFVMVGKG